MTTYVIMGVAGCGKSTIGRQAAQALGLPFLEGDDYHSAENIEKMDAGSALTHEDRLPWVDAMVAACKAVSPPSKEKEFSVILACSALTKLVRSRLREGLDQDCAFIHLHGDQNSIHNRLTARKGHFFRADLLASQFETLEIPEGAVSLDIELPIEVLTEQLCEIIRSENDA